MSLSTHAQRWLTSLVLLPVLACLLVCGGWFLFWGVLVIALLGLWEFYSLFWPGWSALGRKSAGVALGAGFLLAAQLGRPYLAGGLLVAAFWAANLAFLCSFSRSQGQARYQNALIFVAGLFYVPFMLHFLLGFRPQETILVLLATFASDTGAYYAGTWWGKRKIWPSVSPKKTWAGALGGALTCVAICLILGLSLGGWPFGEASALAWVGLGLALNLASQMGDFFESALKRSLDVKDSGALLPGHGGVLDRIDSLLLVTPVYMGASLLLALF